MGVNLRRLMYGSSDVSSGGGTSGGALVYEDVEILTTGDITTDHSGKRLFCSGSQSLTLQTGSFQIGDTIRLNPRGTGRFTIIRGVGVSLVDPFNINRLTLTVPSLSYIDIICIDTNKWMFSYAFASEDTDCYSYTSATAPTTVVSGTPIRLNGTATIDQGINLFQGSTIGSVRYMAIRRYLISDVIVHGSIKSDTAGINALIYIHNNNVVKTSSQLRVFIPTANVDVPFSVSYSGDLSQYSYHGAYVDADTNCILTGDFKIEVKFRGSK